MRILIDECLDWRLCRALTDHQCASVQSMGWGGLTNGKLLERAQNSFDVFLTSDQNLTFQQNVSRFKIAIVVLRARSTRLTDTIRLIPSVLTILPLLKPGSIVEIDT